MKNFCPVYLHFKGLAERNKTNKEATITTDKVIVPPRSDLRSFNLFTLLILMIFLSFPLFTINVEFCNSMFVVSSFSTTNSLPFL